MSFICCLQDHRGENNAFRTTSEEKRALEDSLQRCRVQIEEYRYRDQHQQELLSEAIRKALIEQQRDLQEDLSRQREAMQQEASRMKEDWSRQLELADKAQQVNKPHHD